MLYQVCSEWKRWSYQRKCSFAVVGYQQVSWLLPWLQYLTEIFKLSVSWIPYPKALLGIALFNPLTPKIRLSTLPSSCYTFPCKSFDQDKNPYLTSLSISITCLLNNARILQEEVLLVLHVNHLWELKG